MLTLHLHLVFAMSLLPGYGLCFTGEETQALKFAFSDFSDKSIDK
jgi:hypothetical protein